MSLSKLSFLVVIFFIGSSFSWKNTTHEFHISKCMIDYAEDEKALQITLHIFLDDLEETIRNTGVKEKLNLCTEKEHADGDRYLLEYIEKFMSLQVNQKEAKYNYLGKEPSEDKLAAWCYLEIENVQQLDELQVKYAVLTELFDDQKNIVQIKGPNKKKGYFLFDNKKNEDSVTF